METGTKLGIAIALLAAAGVGGYFFWKYKQNEEEDYSDYTSAELGGMPSGGGVIAQQTIVDSGIVENEPLLPDFSAMSQSEIKAYHNNQLTPEQLKKKTELNAAASRLKVNFGGGYYDTFSQSW